jgi:adenylate cyclase
VYSILGFPEPGPEDHLSLADEAAMEQFLDVWGYDPVVAARAARLFGDAVWRAVEGWARLFLEQFIVPALNDRAVPEEAKQRAIQKGRRVTDSSLVILRWLALRYMERATIAANVENADLALRAGASAPSALIGARAAGVQAMRAVVFADVTGYTAQTHEMGDERAAIIALRLRDHAEAAARGEGGRLVKLLGDGAVLMFRAPEAAFAATRSLVGSWPADLPGLHVGIGIGSVLELDGDVYGTTVNVAARLSQAARPGQILAASLEHHDALQVDGSTAIGPLTLKGIPTPVSAMEIATISTRALGG